MNYFLVASIAGIILMMVVISYYDMKLHLISDSHTLALLLYVFLYKFIKEEMYEMLNGIILAMVLNLVVFYAVRWWYESEEYGLGDVFLHGCVGAFFGASGYFNYWLFSVMLLGFAVMLLLVFRIISRNTAVPMAPAIFGTACCFYWLGRPDLVKMMGL